MKTTLVAMSLLGLLTVSSVQAQGLDARPCDTQDDCPTVLCCGWATPVETGKGYEHKICYKPSETFYTSFNQISYGFECDPSIQKMNFDAANYEQRFWIDLKKSGPMNVPGYGPSRKWIPPIPKPTTLLAIFDRFALTAQFRYSPLLVGFISWLQNFGSGDSWDGFWYNNAAAAGSQLYPTGLSKYFDVHSTQGLFDYFFHWIWDVIQEIMLPYTLLIPVDIWLAWFNGASAEGAWKIFLFYMPFALIHGFGIIPSLVAWYFKVEMEDGWGILNN